MTVSDRRQLVAVTVIIVGFAVALYFGLDWFLAVP